MKKYLGLLFLLLISPFVLADNVPITTVPLNWKLQNYLGGYVVVWYSGSACGNGKLTFGSNATQDDKNRFWSLILSAKVANKKAQVYYEDSGAPNVCEITSFALMQE